MALFNIWVTRRCNLKCPYCYEGTEKEHKDLKREDIPTLIDFILHTPSRRDSVGVNFHGGEPLIRFDLIEEIISRLEGRIHANYSFTTNGTLLNDDIIRKIKKYGIYISLSLDGGKRTHDKYRIFADGAGSFELVNRNLEKLRGAGVPTRIRMTVLPEDVDELYENIYEMVKMGCKVVVAAPDFYSENWNDGNLMKLREQNRKIVALGKQLRAEDDAYDIVLFDNVKPEAKGICTGGINEFNIDVDGRIYPCTYVAGNRKYCIGTIHRGIDGSRVKVLKKMYGEKMDDCEGCSFAKYCLAYRCRFLNEALTGQTGKAPKLICELEHMVFRQFMGMQ